MGGGSRAFPNPKIQHKQLIYRVRIFMRRAGNNVSIGSHVEQSSFLFHLIGYGLLIFVLFDLIDVLLPPRFMDPAWEFQTIGAVVERVPLPLIGFVLVFYGETDSRVKWEPFVLKILSWAALLIGIIFLLIIPLCVSNTVRINNLNNDRITTQASQQMTQIQQVEEQVGKATPNDLESLLNRAKAQGSVPDIQNPQELKSRLLAEVNKAEKNLKKKTEVTRKNRRLELLKSTFKWSLGSLLSGCLFICIWQSSRWARVSTKR